ncbi:Myb-like DNA-binding domain containing protein [Tritrichomonas foetus]|uniref:Myb-like DNA-binding domain containing protein n=1 Tax=Tritrichomonas foetus TaxID=1144522 RepID=A0A1J4KDC4_9EUKA|nr:Myb-like DNA-binding domain containing protein [Tritrichomonas foetus]|eukprot:OHT08912.1 Myb-like DNA-binding domain containing protein [Tritrichomonas foetus]
MFPKSKSGKGHSRSRQKMKFTLEEDERLKKIVRRYGSDDWELICEHMPGRNPRQCKERYLNYLAPNVNYNPWSETEDKLLIKKRRELGPKWVKISKFFKGRSDTQIKNRFMVLTRRMNSEAQALESTLTQTVNDEFHPTPVEKDNCVSITWEFIKKQIKEEIEEKERSNLSKEKKPMKQMKSNLIKNDKLIQQDKSIYNDDEMDFWAEAFHFVFEGNICAW